MKKIYLIFLLCVNPAFAAVFNSDIQNGCDTEVVHFNASTQIARLRARFEPNSHTCGAGYFLPANTDGCRACPSGYTCPGGTFNFNERQAQGINKKQIISQSTANICSVNLIPHGRLTATFTPNETITVNFNNGETTETITCVYDTELTLPETPTRVGYTFAGWKVHKEE